MKFDVLDDDSTILLTDPIGIPFEIPLYVATIKTCCCFARPLSQNAGNDVLSRARLAVEHDTIKIDKNEEVRTLDFDLNQFSHLTLYFQFIAALNNKVIHSLVQWIPLPKSNAFIQGRYHDVICSNIVVKFLPGFFVFWIGVFSRHF